MQNSTTILGIIEMRLRGISYDDCRSLGIPMIILNVTGVMKRVDPEMKDVYDARARECVADIFNYHVKPELGRTLENVGPNGETRLNVTEGHMVNPGHDSRYVILVLNKKRQFCEFKFFIEYQYNLRK